MFVTITQFNEIIFKIHFSLFFFVFKRKGKKKSKENTRWSIERNSRRNFSIPLSISFSISNTILKFQFKFAFFRLENERSTNAEEEEEKEEEKQKNDKAFEVRKNKKKRKENLFSIRWSICRWLQWRPPCRRKLISDASSTCQASCNPCHTDCNRIFACAATRPPLEASPTRRRTWPGAVSGCPSSCTPCRNRRNEIVDGISRSSEGCSSPRCSGWTSRTANNSWAIGRGTRSRIPPRRPLDLSPSSSPTSHLQRIHWTVTNGRPPNRMHSFR